MAQGRSTKIISMIEWIWIIRLSMKNSLSYVGEDGTALIREREREKDCDRKNERATVSERERVTRVKGRERGCGV